jgi:Transposase and inactivated derivatives
MPRTARVINEAGIYHIMARSISDVPLFKNDDDKTFYLTLIKKYQTIFRFKVYAYCLMTTHVHIIIDCCGANISKIMHPINQCYAAYFNKKYSRHGHVFGDRFKSKLVDDDKYLINLSAYIHNNPKDICEYKNSVEKYEFSSLGIYLGIAEDSFMVLDVDFILGHFSMNKSRGRISYLEYINRLSDAENEIDIEFKNDGSQCRNERKILLRNFNPKNIISYVSKYTNLSFSVHIKYVHKHTELKSICILLLRSLCNFSLKQICSSIGNITVSNIRRLCNLGYTLITSDVRYMTLIEDLISDYSTA